MLCCFSITNFVKDLAPLSFAVKFPLFRISTYLDVWKVFFEVMTWVLRIPDCIRPSIRCNQIILRQLLSRSEKCQTNSQDRYLLPNFSQQCAQLKKVKLLSFSKIVHKIFYEDCVEIEHTFSCLRYLPSQFIICSSSVPSIPPTCPLPIERMHRRFLWLLTKHFIQDFLHCYKTHISSRGKGAHSITQCIGECEDNEKTGSEELHC